MDSFGQAGIHIAFVVIFLYNKKKAVQKFAGGVYEEKNRNWNTEF